MTVLIQKGNLVLEDGVVTADLRIEGETIAEIGQNLTAGPDEQLIDASGKYVMPGVIDAHVHFKMPLGNVYTIDNFETGSRSAACGGVTTTVDYADPLPGKSLVESLDYRRREARRSYLDHTFHMVITPECNADRAALEELKKYGVNSLKLFTTYGDMLNYEQIRDVMVLAKDVGLVVTVHAEDDRIIKDKIEELLAEGKDSPRYHAVSRPAEAEIQAVEKLVEFCRELDTSVHIVHVSSGETAEVIRKAREEGLRITGETCPHYLVLNDEVYEREDAQLFIMQPPLRKPQDQELLWKNVAAGTFDLLTTDHCSYCEGQKVCNRTFHQTNGGIPGVETLLPVTFSEGVSKGRITVEQLSRMLSLNPARMFGLYPKKGTLKPGSDADVVIVDPEVEVTLEKEMLHSAADYSPFEGMKLIGYPVCTISRGTILFRDGRFLVGEPEGRFASIHD